jgi:lipoprotein-anchoring transpeptidase ErfK/SrfK
VRRAWTAVALVVVAALGTTSCSSGGAASAEPPSSAASGPPSLSAGPQVSPSPVAVERPVVTISPSTGASRVRPDAQVQVAVQHGTVASVQVRADGGAVVTGGLGAAGTSWRTTAPLRPGASYTVTAQVRAADGTTSTTTSTFRTLRPAATTGLTLIPGDDWVVGVGMPVIVQFARPVRNRDAALRALTVATTPQLEGGWRWMSDQSVWWRPRDYWPAGTKVHVTAAVDGAELSPGVWGRRTYTSSFAIGSSVVSTVDLQKHRMTVTKDGAVVRVLPITAGRNDPRFRTRGGTKVIMEKLESVRMDATTTGTDPKDPEFYDTVEHWAMRLTWSGEYLHARPGSDWAFGRSNISHGCTGLSWTNAKWLFDFSKIGDVVRYTGSSRPLEFGNGYTAWDLPFERWVGSEQPPA